jgi:hypothetical protein
MVHGGERNADQYFETATAAGFLARALDNTVIVLLGIRPTMTSAPQTKLSGQPVVRIRGGPVVPRRRIHL